MSAGGDAEVIHVLFDRHPYEPDVEGYCWNCGEDDRAHARGYAVG